MGKTGHGGGKGTVTPLLKGKVRIPPPAGYFFDPPPLLALRIVFQDLEKIHKKALKMPFLKKKNQKIFLATKNFFGGY